MHAPRRFGQNVVLSLSGSILPALVGVAGTILLLRSSSGDASVTVLTAWTLLGYMVLSDLGLTRSASKLVSAGTAPTTAVGTLWRTALPLGIALSALTLVVGLLVSPWLLLLVPVPLLTALQFPVAGALEASGQFAVLAGQRLINALTVYLLPPLAIALLDPAQGIPVGFGVLLLGRVVLFWYLFAHLAVPLRATLGATFDRKAGSQAHLVFWVGLSSIVGPAFLYADRLAVSLGAFSDGEWVDYTALSELLLKSYVIPSAVLAVVFPWLATRASAHLPLLRKLVSRGLPLAAFAGAGLVTALGFLVPSDLVAVILPIAGDRDGMSAIVLLVVATGLNWISQVYIAVLQGFDRQKVVAVWQLALALPFAGGLLIASVSGSLAVVAAVALARIALLAIILALEARRTLASRT
ncbi:hypothetical protein DXT68_13285 [Microbacterium foliorum]|uniref:Polysaccharide biosynthesis protein n=1 Tax=Microbacterium foliorum TaxID=104336 RepID=A0A0F0KN92_9MICO|nr:hypothetical protein DXT68_13285 [Microbacterium foliorum]KJL22343.1 hypothetical protein RN50_01461 [Microbacterium foliorum]